MIYIIIIYIIIYIAIIYIIIILLYHNITAAGADDREFIYIFFWGGGVCVVAFVCDRSTLEKKKSKAKSKQKQNDITIITVIKTRQNLPPKRPPQRPVLHASQKIFFLEKVKTRNLVIFFTAEGQNEKTRSWESSRCLEIS